MRRDRTCCCRTDVRKRCCSAPRPSPSCSCSPRGLNLHPELRKGSRGELFRYVSRTGGRILGTGPAETSRETSQMFLGGKGRKVRSESEHVFGCLGEVFELRPTHEGVAGRETLQRLAVAVSVSLLRGRAAVTLLVGGAMMEAGVGKLHQNSRGAEVKGLGDQVVPPLRARQAAAVGLDADRPLVNGTPCREKRRGRHVTERVP